MQGLNESATAKRDLKMSPQNQIEESTAKWIYPNPDKPGDAEVRTAGTGIPVWALIAYIPAVKNDTYQVAKDYGIEVEAVEAAIEYYHEHKPSIDARFAIDASYAP